MAIYGAGYRPLDYRPTSAMRRLWPIACQEYKALFRRKLGVFAFIANFGILARQRAQVLPFLFILLALPAFTDRRGTRGRDRGAQPAHAAPKTVELVDMPVLAPPRART